MVIANPWYIDAQARHLASQQRLLAYNAMEGKEGILDSFHLSVEDLDTPTDAIRVMPGAYSILARHLGGNFEAYVGKISVAETVIVNPTSSSGPRTDLVILRVENPYVSGSGSWAQPADPLDGPYVHVRVIEGVNPNINHVSMYNDTWSAITLAKITRPANTSIVTQAHITNLRSIARLGEERIIIIESPPVEAPPIAYQYWTESTPISNNQQLLMSQTSFVNFPDQASWQVPVPSWARGMDVNVLLNPRVNIGNVYGEMRLVVQGESTGAVPSEFDYNWVGAGNEARNVIMIGGTESLQQSWCGKVVNMRLQARSKDAGNTGRLECKRGTRVNIFLNFKRYPVYSDGSP